MSRLDDLARVAVELSLRHGVAEGRVAKERKELKLAKREAAAWEGALSLLQGVAAGVQQKAHESISRLVSLCLATVFDDPYTFHVDFSRRRGKTEADLYFMRDGERFGRPWTVGGGVIDVAAFALRLSCLVLTRPPLQRVLILDEPFRNVHGAANRRRARALIETVPKELGVQIILSTGMDWLEIGRVVEIR
jgi:hypothetical protein